MSKNSADDRKKIITFARMAKLISVAKYLFIKFLKSKKQVINKINVKNGEEKNINSRKFKFLKR